MKYILTGIAAAAALGMVTFTPDAAQARDRGIGIYVPGVGIEIGPRYKYGKRYYRDRGYSWRDRRDWRYPRAYGPRYGYDYDRRWDRRYYR